MSAADGETEPSGHFINTDRVHRTVDIDQGGSEEIVLIETDVLRGVSLVVLSRLQAASGHASGMGIRPT